MGLPYIQPPPLDLTWLGLGRTSWFPVTAALAVAVSLFLYDRLLERARLDSVRPARLLMLVMVIGGYLGGYWGQLFFYRPDLLSVDPWVWLKIWRGSFSSTSGFFAAFGAGWFYLYRFRLHPFGYIDIAWVAFTFAWVVARTGCALVHDHIGNITTFPLAVRFPDGLLRHDLGLYELIFTVLCLIPLCLVVTSKPWRAGSLTALIFLTYSPVRFLLDFLRTGDTRYGGLTPAQYGMIALVFIGVWLLYMSRKENWPMVPALFGKNRK
jgi:phosphatidylglycerol:prolipoprotein diacylglycerol transferase